jgi:hypothetical protein
MIWSAVMSWTYGILWGLFCAIVVPLAIRRWPGYCGRPKSAGGHVDSQLQGSSWQQWIEREKHVPGIHKLPAAVSSSGGMAQNYVPPQPVPVQPAAINVPPPASNPYINGVVGATHKVGSLGVDGALPPAVPVLESVRTPLLSSQYNSAVDAPLLHQSINGPAAASVAVTATAPYTPHNSINNSCSICTASTIRRTTNRAIASVGRYTELIICNAYQCSVTFT